MQNERRPSGFVMFEIIVSMALFGLVATSLVVALNRLAKVSHASRLDSRIIRRMDSVMTEFLRLPGRPLSVGARQIAPDATGVTVDVTVTEERIISREGIPLQGIYRVRFVGRITGEPTVERVQERLVFSPSTVHDPPLAPSHPKLR